MMRNTTISGQMPGHEYIPGEDLVVLLGNDQHAVKVRTAKSGWDVIYAGKKHEVRSDWQFGQYLYQGTFDGEPFCMQVERQGLRQRLFHWGTQADVLVVTVRIAELHALMPHKAPPDMSKFLLSPMPGLLTQIAVQAGQEVKAGEVLARIEAMKMENVLKAERDCTVEKLLAKSGESLAVDQPIIAFK
jgi:propionyl-CoA carboxylase alpha chain